MPSSPRTPHARHSRDLSMNTDFSFASPLNYTSSSRRDSKASQNTPSTPNRNSLVRSDSNFGIDVYGAGGAAPSNGLGNLADELADAWSDGEEEDEEPDLNFHQESVEVVRDSGVDIPFSPSQPPLKSAGLVPPTPMQKGHRRAASDYDGSDYGGDSDLESPGVPPSLAARIDAVEGLVRRGTENNGTDRDGVVLRVIESLKDLGAQGGVEGNATRLITAHTALSTHLIHQTRLLQNLAYPLFSPLSTPPDSETIDELLPLLLTMTESIPRPTTAAFTSLTALHTLTADLVQTLNYLSDTLHMSRQTTTTAARRLKSAMELVKEIRKEEEEREEGELWLQKGDWGRRLESRECAGVCGDVVGGFEEVCNGWRERLLNQAEGVGA
ncbi:hypothetical protein BP5796_04773 [Coleophoma crateriformis]|uniref:Uncharacterized protein n=1 Tax=Coleophoma crateriformis TaxID=565419 RepID=A0A3D8SA84_9HELO|nr:hypothetical protein BP5796_04773 [Coleophoma crateriformis]